jgi:hypothetical protein
VGMGVGAGAGIGSNAGTGAGLGDDAGGKPLETPAGGASVGTSWLSGETGIAPMETLKLAPTGRATGPVFEGWSVHADGSGPTIGGM